MILYFLTRPVLNLTTALLVGHLERRGCTVHVVFSGDDVRGKYVRYGNSDTVPSRYTDIGGSSRDCILLCSNKLTFSKLMEDHNIKSPIFYSGTPARGYFPVVVRKKIKSYGGNGIVVCKTPADYTDSEKGFFWTSFLPQTHEFRVHVLGGKIVKVFSKSNSEDNSEFPIRTSSNGYHYSLVDHTHMHGLKSFCKDIYLVMPDGSNMYSLDIGYNSESKRYTVFEANSASGLNSKTAVTYGDFIYNKLCLVMDQD